MAVRATLTVDPWRARPRAFHLPPPESDVDESADDSPQGDLSLIVENTGEPSALASSVPSPVPSTSSTTAPVAPAHVPQASMPSTPQEPLAPMPTARSGIAGPSTFALPQQYITLSTRDFLTIMEVVRTFSSTAASFAASQATLAERMTCTEATVAKNQAILFQLQSHLGLPTVFLHAPAQASAIPLLAGSAPPPTAPADSLDVLAATAATATPPATPQPAPVEDDSSPATD